jgi:DNA replication protein DnaC
MATLKLPIKPEELDAALARAESAGLSHLDFLQALLADPANLRRERSIARRIKDACFRDVRTLLDFDWEFNKAIKRPQIEELATGEFIRRRTNWVLVGQSGTGKSHIVQAVGRSACVVGYRVHYITSAKLLKDLTAGLADRTLPQRVGFYARWDLLLIDEFGFDRIERNEAPQSANLLYKIIDARSQQRSTALVTNIDFESWADYLGDPPLAMAFLDRIVDGAIILKFQGKSYRAHRAQRPDKPKADE